MNREGQVWEFNFNGKPERGLILKSQYVTNLYVYYPYGKHEVWNHHVVLVESLLASLVFGKKYKVFRKWKEYSDSPWERWGKAILT